jgi:hypothetical protein
MEWEGRGFRAPPTPPAPRTRETAHIRDEGRRGCALLLDVPNIWFLTRRRALDYGRVTTAGC